MRALVASALTFALLAVLGLWAGCGDQGDGDGGGAGTGAQGATGGASGASGMGGAGGVPLDARPPCEWPGWYVAPRLPADCDGLCVPDDVKQRIPPATWAPRPEICSGCTGLVTPWAPADSGALDHPVAGGIFGVGPGVRAYSIDLLDFENADTVAYFEESGAPIAAWRRQKGEDCGFGSGVAFSDSGLVAQNFRTTLGEAQSFVLRPTEKLHELMTATDTTLLWPKAFVNQTIPTRIWFSAQRVAAFFSGRVAIGDIATGSTLWVDGVPGALPGQYSAAQVVGDTVFVSRFDFSRNDWWSYSAAGELKLFLGGAGKDIYDLVTDGTTIVWMEGSQPELNDAGATVFAKWDVYKAPFANNGSDLQPELLVANVPAGIYWLQMENGYVSGVYRRDPLSSTPVDAFVVRVADGWAAKSELQPPYHWGLITFPTPTELWGGAVVDASGKARTIVRVPYQAMQVVQTAVPKQGGAR